MAIDRDDALRKAEKLLRQGRLDGAICGIRARRRRLSGRHRHGLGPGRPLRPRRQGLAGRVAVHAARRPLPQGRRPRQGGGQLPQGPQARRHPRRRAAPARRSLRPAGPAGRRQDPPPVGDRQAEGARRSGRRRHAGHPPGRARSQRLRSPPPGGGDPGADRQGGHRRPAGAGQGARLPQARERGRGRCSRRSSSATPAPPRCRCASPRRRSAATKWRAPSASCPTPAPPRIRSCCSPAARSCSSSTTSTPPATTWCASWRPRPKAVEEVATLGEHLASPNARYAIVDLLVDHAAASGDFGKAARRLQGFLEKAPRHLAGAAAPGRGLRRRRSRRGADGRAAGAGRGLSRGRRSGEGPGHRRGPAAAQPALVDAQRSPAPRAGDARREGSGRRHRRAAVAARRGRVRRRASPRPRRRQPRPPAPVAVAAAAAVRRRRPTTSTACSRR